MSESVAMRVEESKRALPTNVPIVSMPADFVNAYNFARRLKTLKGLIPYEYLCKLWTQDPDRLILDPTHHFAGLYT